MYGSCGYKPPPRGKICALSMIVAIGVVVLLRSDWLLIEYCAMRLLHVAIRCSPIFCMLQ